MKHLRETFTDQEFAQLQEAKKLSGKNWHDFIMMCIPQVIIVGKDMSQEEVEELKRKWESRDIDVEVAKIE